MAIASSKENDDKYIECLVPTLEIKSRAKQLSYKNTKSPKNAHNSTFTIQSAAKSYNIPT